MPDKKVFVCDNCHGVVELGPDEADRIPECCGKAMKATDELDQCQTSTTAEHSRMDKIDEPCDDGRAG